MDLNSFNQSRAAGTMTIKFTDTGFGPLAPGSDAFSDAIGGTTFGTVLAANYTTLQMGPSAEASSQR